MGPEPSAVVFRIIEDDVGDMMLWRRRRKIMHRDRIDNCRQDTRPSQATVYARQRNMRGLGCGFIRCDAVFAVFVFWESGREVLGFHSQFRDCAE